MDQQEDLADVDTDASSAPAFSRRGLIAGIAGIGAVGATTGLLAACAPEDKVGVGAGAGTPDSSRIVLGGQPILDTDFPDGATPLAPLKDRVLALKALLISKGVVKDEMVNGFVTFYQTQVGPQYGKAVVAHAWTDPAFMKSLINPPAGQPFAATKIVAGYLASLNDKALTVPQLPGSTIGPEGEWLRVVANGRDPKTGKRIHNMVTCSACSCYPQALLGVQPVWYKSQQYRARSVRAPRGVMREFAAAKGPDAEKQLEAYLATIDEVRVWDSNSEARFLVIPERPASSAGQSETQLRSVVTRNSMVGVEIL
ncbi:MAG: nitrile hydratase subunit alpha [Candidatus Nanopelagicales bacterium]